MTFGINDDVSESTMMFGFNDDVSESTISLSPFIENTHFFNKNIVYKNHEAQKFKEKFKNHVQAQPSQVYYFSCTSLL